MSNKELTEIGMLEQMEVKDFRYTKDFQPQDNNLKTMDDAVINFVRKLMKELRNLGR